jgi:hypothetical protein
LVCALASLLVPANPARADVFYAASGSNGVAGNLYTLDPTTGIATLVGPLVDSSGAAYGLTGLAFQPGTNVLYGSTANASPTNSGDLVTVNPATGLVTDIGAFGVGFTMADITFTPDGTLFGWHSAGNHSLYTINLTTGAATLVATSNINTRFGGGGLASSSSGVIFSTPDGTTNPPGNLFTIDRTTGQAALIAPLSGGPVGDNVINAMAFNSQGILFGINTDRGFPAATHLVRINTTTGAITDVGATPDNLDALAILRPAQAPAIPEPTSLMLLAVGGTGVALWGRWRRRSR